MCVRFIVLTLSLFLFFMDGRAAGHVSHVLNHQVKRNVGPNPFTLLKNLFPAKRTMSRSNYTPDSYVVRGKKYQTMKSAVGYKERGSASWYRSSQKTSSGEQYNMHAMTAAHRTLPMHTRVMVKNLKNGRSVVVRINDRGPFHSNRLIDVSYAAARQLGLCVTGTAVVELQAVSQAIKPASTAKTSRVAIPHNHNKTKLPAKRKARLHPQSKPKVVVKPNPIIKSKVRARAILKRKPKMRPTVNRPLKSVSAQSSDKSHAKVQSNTTKSKPMVKSKSKRPVKSNTKK